MQSVTRNDDENVITVTYSATIILNKKTRGRMRSANMSAHSRRLSITDAVEATFSGDAPRMTANCAVKPLSSSGPSQQA